MADSIEQLSYELTANALGEQERTVTALRTRAGTILAAASIAGSFLGTKASHGSLDAWAIGGMIAFLLCLSAAIIVLPPRVRIHIPGASPSRRQRPRRPSRRH